MKNAQKPSILVVGSGLSGAVIARELAEKGLRVDVVEQRLHIAGNIYTEVDQETGIIKHIYGPHIFNTDNELVWNYVNGFTNFDNFINRVKTSFQNQIYSMPINLHTINQFFAKNFSPQQAKDFIEHIRFKDLRNPKNFEEQALSMLGSDLYEAFLKNYTIKQWGCDPKEIPASVLKRLPLRFNYNDNYYNKKYQGIPTKGYTDLVENILDHKNISVSLGVKFNRTLEDGYEKVFYTGKIDEYFDYCFGHLGYRTVYWEDFIHEGDFQGNPVINYSDRQIPYTRVIEHKHFSPNSNHDKTLISLEYSKETTIEDEPFYPKRLAADIQILEKYQDLISQQIKVVFLGRLATYRYLDMDKVIEEALEQAKVFMNEDVNI